MGDVIIYHKQLTAMLLSRNEIDGAGFEAGVEQLAFSISPGSYLTRSVHNVGGRLGNSKREQKKK